MDCTTSNSNSQGFHTIATKSYSHKINKNMIMLKRVKITTEVFFRALDSALSSFIVEDVV
jgi:hypothetical protein